MKGKTMEVYSEAKENSVHACVQVQGGKCEPSQAF